MFGCFGHLHGATGSVQRRMNMVAKTSTPTRAAARRFCLRMVFMFVYFQ
jgi:hypothetical protein